MVIKIKRFMVFLISLVVCVFYVILLKINVFYLDNYDGFYFELCSHGDVMYPN